MKDISAKHETLRTAVAEAYLKIDAEVLASVEGGRKTDKGDALECARVAGVMAAKKTWETIPFCHPIPVTYANVAYRVEEGGIHMEATVKTLASTGVEMEALNAVSVCALTLYDMLKPHAPADTGIIEIQSIRLQAKTGGKSHYKPQLSRPVRAAVLVISDAVLAGTKQDRAGQVVRETLERYEGVALETYEVLGESPDELVQSVEGLLVKGVDLLITVGGTGLLSKDLTVEALAPMLQREIPGIMEAARVYGQQRTPYAMLSRGIAGMIDDTVLLTFPGSRGGARQTCEALFPGILHIFDVRDMMS